MCYDDVLHKLSLLLPPSGVRAHSASPLTNPTGHLPETHSRQPHIGIVRLAATSYPPVLKDDRREQHDG